MPVFTLYLSALAISELVAVLMAYRALRAQTFGSDEQAALLTLALLAFLCMVPLSSFAWSHAPALRYVQFPWRWLMVLSFATVAMVVMALRNISATWRKATTVAIAVFIGANVLVLQRDWHKLPVRDWAAQIRIANGYQGMGEYAPIGAQGRLRGDPGELFLSRTDSGAIHAAEVMHAVYGRRFEIEVPQETAVVAQLNAYPRWQITVNGTRAPTSTQPVSGRLLFRVPAGKSDVEIRFARTPDQIIGVTLSLLALSVVGLLAALRKQALAGKIT